jgi:glycosyltransferase involved in cell wall biosynthesis
MKVAVITPYHEPNSPYLKDCIDSVKSQTHADVIHVLIGDGCTLPTDLEHPSLHNIPLPRRLNNYGDSPRSIGVVYAFSLGADAVAFLDSDNWYAPNHIELMVQNCLATQSDVVTSLRYIAHLNGETLGVCPESDGSIFCDTNCLFVTRRLAEEAGVWWLIPDDMHVIDDRVIWDTLIHATDRISCTDTASVFYRSAFEVHYRMFCVPAPQGAKAGMDIYALHPTIEALQQRAKSRALER